MKNGVLPFLAPPLMTNQGSCVIIKPSHTRHLKVLKKEMIMKKLLKLSVALLLSTSLAACAPKTTSDTKSSVEPQQIVAKHSDVRLKFNQIQLAKADKEFKGGSNLAKLKELYGEPVKHEEVPAGDVTLDAYKWQFDQVEVNVQFYEDNAITRAISYFSFIKEPSLGLKEVEQLQKDMTYTQVLDLLGEPDALSQAVSSDKEELQAIWTSGLKTDNQAQIQLLFENNKLKTINHNGLKD